MAARRLIAILLVMLFLSSLAAALAPVQQGVEEGGSDSTTTESTSSPAGAAKVASSAPQLIRQSIHAAPGGKPQVIRAKLGDQLQLRVTSEKTGTLELVGLGPAEDVGPEQPAFFDVLLERDGTFPVQFLDLEAEREFAQIEVSAGEEAISDR